VSRGWFALTYVHRWQIAELATQHLLPTLYKVGDYVVAGGLMSYGLDYRENLRWGMTYVDRILRGAQPKDLPVEQVSKFELVINLKTAKALGLTIPPMLLARANGVIELDAICCDARVWKWPTAAVPERLLSRCCWGLSREAPKGLVAFMSRRPSSGRQCLHVGARRT